MLNKADTEIEIEARLKALHGHASNAIGASRHPSEHTPCRELTVGEWIDQEIERADRRGKNLRTLKEALSLSFLSAGASRISVLQER